MRILADEIKLESSIAKQKLSDPDLLASLLKLLGIIAISILISNLVSYFYTNTEQLLKIIEGAKGFAPFIIISLIVLEVIIAPLPGFIIMVASGYLFGPLLGGLYSYIGNVLGSLIAFFLAHKYGRPFVEKIISHRVILRYDAFFQRYKQHMLFLYMLPIIPVDILSFILGLSNTPLKRFSLIVLVGFIPNTLILSYFGSFLSELDAVVSALYFAIFIVIFIGLAWLFKKLSERLTKS